MIISLVSTSEDERRWADWLTDTDANLWQSPDWKSFQEALGRKTRVYLAKDGDRISASALVIIDTTTGGYSTWDIPRGPIGSEDALGELMERIVTDARQEKCLALFFNSIQGNCEPARPAGGLRIANCKVASPSPRCEHSSHTRIIPLLEDEELMKQMKPKGRYNIRLAQKKGVQVRESDDIDTFYSILQKTGQRDGFGILSKRHYKTMLEAIPSARLSLAFSEKNEPIAGLLSVYFGNQAIYYYGASDTAFRALMAPYALQWVALTSARAAGYTEYDLLGIAPPDSTDHHLAGVSTFKEKFGGEVREVGEERMIVLRPLLWRMLQMKRKLIG